MLIVTVAIVACLTFIYGTYYKNPLHEKPAPSEAILSPAEEKAEVLEVRLTENEAVIKVADKKIMDLKKERFKHLAELDEKPEGVNPKEISYYQEIEVKISKIEKDIKGQEKIRNNAKASKEDARKRLVNLTNALYFPAIP